MTTKQDEFPNVNGAFSVKPRRGNDKLSGILVFMPILKNIGAIAKGMSITFLEMFQPTTVENYPDGPGPLRGAKFQERFRGIHVLRNRYVASEMPKEGVHSTLSVEHPLGYASPGRFWMKTSRRQLIGLTIPAIAAAQTAPARRLNVVCVGGHPDDPESGCGRLAFGRRLIVGNARTAVSLRKQLRRSSALGAATVPS